MKVETLPDTAALASRAADLFEETVKAHDQPVIILPTGNTPLPFYAELRRRFEAGATHLGRFTYLQLDEYKDLPDADPRLFAQWLDREVLGPLHVENRITFHSAASDPAHEIDRFKESFHRAGGTIHLAILGLGTNGHVGFNEPPSPFDTTTRVVTLTDETRRTNAAYWGDINQVPTQAYTLGIQELQSAEKTMMLVSGSSKKEALERLQKDAITPDFPASYLRQQPHGYIIHTGGS